MRSRALRYWVFEMEGEDKVGAGCSCTGSGSEGCCFDGFWQGGGGWGGG